MSVEQQAARLRELLSGEDLGPDDAAAVVPQVDDAVQAALVHALATGPGPAPNGFLLARLKFLRDAADEGELARVYLANTSSPDPGARTASLYGLHEMELPQAEERARTALDDTSPQVVAAAADVLLRRSGDDAGVRSLLAAAAAAHRDEPAFRTALVLLRGHGIGEGPPADGGATA